VLTFSSPIGYDTINYAVVMKNLGLSYAGFVGERLSILEDLQCLFGGRVLWEVLAMEELNSVIEDNFMLLYYRGVTPLGGS
jgi:hypothetical protein